MPRIALFGGSFNPPGIHHRAIAAEVAREFDRVIVVPCGPRPDKPISNDVAPVYRAAMVDMNFRGLDRVNVDLFDLEANTFTKTHDLEERFRSEGDVWHVVGADLVRGGRRGDSPIQRQWYRGLDLWDGSRFAVIERPGYEVATDDLPPNHRLFRTGDLGSSSAIRSGLFHQQPVDGMMTPQVAAFIERHGLYRGLSPSREGRFQLGSQRLMIVASRREGPAQDLAGSLRSFESDDPELIVVIGGDGTMLRAIREHWRRRIPFYGINTGHLGFLLNADSPLHYAGRDLVVGHVPLLYVEMEGPDGSRQTAVAFNDAWVERATGQTAWIQVKVNGEERLPQLVADGALVATAAGSTSYARAMGATPLPLNTPAMLLVGSNVLKPDFWRPAVLPLDSSVELTTLDPVKRPLQAYIDGVSAGQVCVLKARVSHIAAAELVFAPGHDPAAKLARIQFPRE